jgi:hypothetical protein
MFSQLGQCCQHIFRRQKREILTYEKCSYSRTLHIYTMYSIVMSCSMGLIIQDKDDNFLRTYTYLKVHKIEIFFGFDFEICIISLLVMSKY